MTARPTEVRIGNHTYSIKWGPIELTDEDDAETDMIYGRTFSPELTIEVDTAPPSREREVFLHELIHGCLDLGSHDLSMEDEERVVRWLTPMLLGMLRENPEVVRYLLKGAKRA